MVPEVKMKKHNKKQTFWMILAVLALGLAACQPLSTPDLSMAGTYAAQTLTAIPVDTQTPTLEATPTVDVTETATPLPEVGPVGPTGFPEDVNPLTGLKVADSSILDRRPVLVKVANYPISGRPHAGLSFADMVFEYYIGAGANRFMGLFYGQDIDQIGPVRSGRLVDPYIVSLYEGVLGMESAYVTVYDHITDILGNRVISGRDTCPALCDDGRYIVTSVFANSEAMTTYGSAHGVDNRRYNLDGMAFDPSAQEGGEDGTKATVLFTRYNRGEWLFDEGTGKYTRWIEEGDGTGTGMIPLVDRITDEQLAFSNVVLLFANYTELAPALHDIDLWNVVGQRAIVFRDGQAYDLTWTTSQKDLPIQYLDENGEVFPLKPGNTWVVIFGENSDVYDDNGEWTFEFYMP